MCQGHVFRLNDLCFHDILWVICDIGSDILKIFVDADACPVTRIVEKQELQKPLDEDWTKNCTTKTVDTMKFVEMMQAVKSGKKIDWACPFCGVQCGF